MNECNNHISVTSKQSWVVLVTNIHSKGTLGNMQIRLKTLQQGYSNLVLEGQNISGLGFLYDSLSNHHMYGSSETLKWFQYGSALKNLIWF